MNKKLSTEPYKGVRDFYPEDFNVQEILYNAMAVTAERYGYARYDASPLEPTELYTTKTSQEIVSEQTYTFEDRGGRSVTLRPEMTPTIARMIAAKRRELVFPVRWYSIPNLFRYERPQHGRLREHRQLNVDIFGIADLRAEEEILTLAYDLLKSRGLSNSQFEIQINDREHLVSQLRELVGEEKLKKALRLVDKKSSMIAQEFTEKWDELSEKPFNVTPCKIVEELRNTLAAQGIKNTVNNPELARGFDYYTGVVFEIFDTGSKNIRSICGGGRYDNLLELFDQEPIPAVGFGLGDVTLRNVLETYNLLPEYVPFAHLCVCHTDIETAKKAKPIIAELRKNRLNIIVADAEKKLGDQISYADKLHIPFVLCIGEKELETGTFTVKELKTGQETKLKQDEIANFILRPKN